jgi:hypothetical protein
LEFWYGLEGERAGGEAFGLGVGEEGVSKHECYCL